ncbi:site-specific integrase [Chelativorans sp. SCAU2101]|uniref:Site-specific integrase n=1 Tax=Chelativorans petroleitrophicus TaxID=2975484 RepID=A0A9X2X657_9HYPH|nr:site-specific integrase [Chelativorans petroleitrophicus]MCT8988859.1 site-specific integrase [Chelativorans petroleitrophicus]
MAKSKNRKTFNPQWIERLKYDPKLAPPSGRMEIEDEACPGLLLRVTPRGVKSFSVIYKVPGEGGVSPNGRLLVGRQHRITLGTTPPIELKDARQQARDLMQAASEGRDPRGERREENLIRHTNTFEAVRKRFIDRIKPNVQAWKNVERVLKLHVEPHWKDKPLRDIRRAHVHEVLDALIAEGKVGTAREVKKHLSRLFNWAVDREIIVDNPVHGLKRDELGPNEEAGRALTDEELRYIWKAADGLGYPFGPMYKLLILTGQRRGEWASAMRSEVNTEKRWLEVPKARYKGGRDHIVPMADEVFSIFEGLPVWEGKDYYLLSTTDGKVPVSGFSKAKARLDAAVLKAMRKADPEAQLTDYRVHDFRVSCKSRLASLGFKPDISEAVLGHAKVGLERTYNKHEYLDEKREALAAYAKHVMEVVK